MAEQFVQERGVGSFLCRNASTRGHVVLTYRTSERILHIAIERDVAWHIVGDTQQWRSLAALVRDCRGVNFDMAAQSIPHYVALRQSCEVETNNAVQSQVMNGSARMRNLNLNDLDDDDDVIDIASSSSSSTTTTTSSLSSSFFPPSSIYTPAPAAAVAATHDRDRVVPATAVAILPVNVRTIVSSDLSLGTVLGEGQFAVVRRGEWRGQPVAVKILKPAPTHLAMQQQAERDLFCNEVQRMWSVPAHNNIVQLLGQAALDDGRLAAVVEFCSEGALVALLYENAHRSGKLTAREKLDIAAQALCGVAHLHQYGVVHRDIAARNVLLNRSAHSPHVTAKVADFGMSRALLTHANEQCSQNLVGPVKWMAPESYTGIYSTMSDMFMVGVLLYELFAAAPPWRDLSNDAAALRVMKGERMQLLPEQCCGDARIANVVQACWNVNAAARPSASNVHRVMTKAIAALSVAALAPVPVAAVASNFVRGSFWGKCTECAECDEYCRPIDGAKCDMCGCVVLKHAKLQ